MKHFQLLILTMLLSGCGLLNLPAVITPKAPDTRYQYHELLENNPTAVAVGDKIVVVQNQRREVSANYINQEKPLNWWQRFLNRLANLSIFVVVIGIGLLAAGIGGPFIWIYNRYLVFRKTMTQVVRAVDESKAVTTNLELKNSLSSNLDTDSKKLIDDIKRS